MKRPKKPTKPIEPKAPKKTAIIRAVAVDLMWLDKTHSVQDVINTLKAIPKTSLSNFFITTDYTRGYYDEIDLTVEIWYNKEVENINYKSQLRSYEKKKREYPIKLKIWKEANKKYLADKKAYDAWNAKRQIKLLTEKLDTLRGQS